MRKNTRGKHRIWILAASVALLGGALLAWHQGLLPFEITQAETGKLKTSADLEDLAFVDQRDAQQSASPAGTESDTRTARTQSLRIRDEIPPQNEPDPSAPSRLQPARTPGSGDLASSFESATSETATRFQDPFFKSDSRSPANSSPSVRNPVSIGRPSTEDRNSTGQESSATRQPEVRPNSIATVDLVEIDRLIEQEQYLKAHEQLSRVYWNQPTLRPTIQARIDQTAYSIYLAPQPHYLKPYVVKFGDNLTGIAKGYDVPWQYLKNLNRITDPSRIQPGQKLKVIKGPFAALVDLSNFELVIHAHGYYVHRYRVGIGRDGTSPIGTFKVLDKVENPAYFGSDGEVIKADDPRNPVGEYWIDIGNQYGIHGTIDPDSIGKAASRGCIRMSNQDVAEVYSLLGVGSEVRIQK
ncbi:MAG: L,D-transpeptidase family protein [Planctomycetota bacterium]|nr:L,D-transpeptidase family protein [Planctomycetota bacterium]